jgi:site-specific DNA recombinase
MTSKNGKRAALYLRVSSAGQVRTDYDPEGLSIPAQREACERKAAQLGAQVVRDYVEAGVSGGSLVKRKAFQKMLADIREHGNIDCVIVWSVSRWARNQEDHWTARGLINRAGAKLISVKEPIGDDTSYGVTIEGILAAVADGRRIEISEEVTRGIQRKVEVGGKPGPAPLGYLNVSEPLPNGGEVRIVIIDPERAEIIRWGYETYATGLYSLIDMVTLLAARGLRSRGNRRYTSRPLKLSAVHNLLSNPFYMGKVSHKEKLYPGRHEPLVDEELFEKVQAVLKAHNLSGERDRKHQHYLKGTIRCGFCDHRLMYSRQTGRGGTYEYFVCAPAQRRECPHGFRRVEDVEAKIEDHYKTIALTTHDRERITSMVERRLAKLASTSKQEIARCDTLLAGLKEQERKLLDKHYKDEISEELFAEEADRIKDERRDAEAITSRLNVRHEELGEFVALALRVARTDLHDLYLRAQPYIRRLMNQAIFEVVWIEDEEEETRSELASPFAEIIRTKSGTRPIDLDEDEPTGQPNTDGDPRVPAGVGARKNAEASGPWEGPENFDDGAISAVMVGREGIEPSTLGLRGPCSAN